MKKYILLIGFMALGVGALPVRSHAQAQELIQLALNIEKLAQLKQILQQLYDGYEILTKGYNIVKDITSGNFKLHEVFLDGLYLVNPSVKKYHRIPDIINYQASIVKEYKAAFKQFSASDVFTAGQLDYFSDVYKHLLDASTQNLEELAMIITAGKLRMSDDERLAGIDRIYADVQYKLLFLRSFNRQHAMIAVESLREKTEQQSLRDLHGME